MDIKKVINIYNNILTNLTNGLDKSTQNLDTLKSLYNSAQEICQNNQLTNTYFFQSLRRNICCIKCSSNLGEINFPCDHFFCKNCLSGPPFTQDQIDSQNCPICVPQADQSSQDLQKLKNCEVCQVPRSVCLFYLTCRCVCIFCMTHYINKSITFCPICGNENESELFKQNSHNLACSICNRKEYIDDLMIDTCQDQILCISCLKYFWQNIDCPKCRAPIYLHDSFPRLRSHLFKECDHCGNTVYSDFIMPKSCCHYNTCYACQARENLSICLFCNQLLETNVVEALRGLVNS